MRKLWILLFILCCNIVFSQKMTQGQVLDYDSGVPIAFAKISYNNNTILSNWEGKFSIEIQDNKQPILFYYPGYFDKTYYQTLGQKTIVIKMIANQKKKSQEIFTETKVDAIIKKVIDTKFSNQPEKAFSTFEYKNYEHLLVTANPDSISSKIDTIEKRTFFGKKQVKLDSSNYKFKKIVEKQHLYQTEKVNLIQHNNKGTKETVIASRMAGFKKPLYEYLGMNLVSYSLYDTKLDILGVSIHNPISYYGRKLYVFKIIDTVKVDGRTAYQIYFQPKKQSSNRLHGLLYIDSENNAICKAYFRIYGMAIINALYTFNFIKAQKIWFAEKRKITVVKGTNSEDLNILGNIVKFNSGLEGLNANASDHSYLKLESSPYDIKINQLVVFKNPKITIEVPKTSMSKPDSYWSTFQKDSIDTRKIPTYTSLDSLSEAEKIEHKIILGRKIYNGYFPLNYVDLDLKTIVKYNNHEGFRLGFGGVTNDKLADNYKISGYVAYGFKDEKLKYGINPSYLLNKETNTWINASYSDDVKEIGQVQFITESKRFKIYDPRPINISTFYNNKVFSAFIESNYLTKTNAYFGISRSAITPLFDYTFVANNNVYSNFNITSVQFALQWNPFSAYMQTPSGRLEIEKKYPKISFQFTKSIPNVMGNDFDFYKIDLRIFHDISYLSGQNTSFILEGGMTVGTLPLTHLYSIAPNNLNKDSMLKRITFAGKNSFETMYFNEFFSSKYITLQARHTFNKVKLGYKINPLFSVVTRMALGTLTKPEQHVGFGYKTLEKVFIESGVEANQIFKGFGITLFYRYGPNGLPKFEDNLSLKISYVLDLGF
jgi:hypothetical protein